jgi:hypothetical protein
MNVGRVVQMVVVEPVSMPWLGTEAPEIPVAPDEAPTPEPIHPPDDAPGRDPAVEPPPPPAPPDPQPVMAR